MDAFISTGDGEDAFILIRSYLTVADLMRCSQTNRQMLQLCSTYTLPGVWGTKDFMLNEPGDLEADTKRCFGEGSGRPRRLVLYTHDSPHFWWWTLVYHPDELDLLNSVIDQHGETKCECLQDEPIDEPGRQELVSATFGNAQYGVVDVTAVVRDRIKYGRFKLVPPRPHTGSYSSATPLGEIESSGKWWYVGVFGDPCPKRTKFLILNVTRDHGETQIYLGENEGCDIRLDIG